MHQHNELEYDYQDQMEDYWVMATFYTKEGETWDTQIGEVTLRKDITYNDMPFELEINGITYKRED